MLKVIKHAEKEDYVEFPDFLGRQFIHAHLAEINPRSESLVSDKKLVGRKTVNGDHLGAVTLRLEGVKPVPTTDIEHALSTQIRFQTEARIIGLQILKPVYAVGH